MSLDMAWNDQNIPVSGPVPAYGPAPPAPGAAPALTGQNFPGGYTPPLGQPVYPGMPGAAPQQGYVGSYAQNSLSQQQSPVQQAPPVGVPNGGMPPQAPARPASPLQPGVQPTVGRPGPIPVAAQESDRIDAGDDIWIERTKKAIAETQNDPHRQVQLLQHLNKLYLKERFGREVQADQA